MKKLLKETIKKESELVKREEKIGQEEKEIQELDKALLSFLENYIRQENNRFFKNKKRLRQSIKDRVKRLKRETLKLQKEKQQIMRELHKSLRCLDDPLCVEPIPKKARVVQAEAGGKLFYYDKNGNRQFLEPSDLAADAEWGIAYFLDPKSVPRAIRKKYLVDSVKKRLQDLYNHQLAILDLAERSKGVLINHKALDKLLEKENSAEINKTIIESIRQNRGRLGFVAERMVYTLFLRKSYDNPQIKTLPATIIHDAYDKVDFIIIRKKPQFYQRGVGIETVKTIKPKLTAIQFTITTSNFILKKKLESIQEAKKSPYWEFDDIILVRVPRNYMLEAFEKWLNAGRPGGGPERFLDKEVSKTLYLNALKGMGSSKGTITFQPL
jgi:hypothetical protein